MINAQGFDKVFFEPALLPTVQRVFIPNLVAERLHSLRNFSIVGCIVAAHSQHTIFFVGYNLPNRNINLGYRLVMTVLQLAVVQEASDGVLGADFIRISMDELYNVVIFGTVRLREDGVPEGCKDF